MKHLSVRTKIMLWYAAILAVMVVLSYIVVFSVSSSVMHRTTRDELRYTVADNLDEVEFFPSMAHVKQDNDADQYIAYRKGFLEVDDDYLDQVNGITTALYRSDNTLLYGSNPIAKQTASLPFASSRVQKVSAAGTVYYVYDRQLTQDGLDGLWLRGIVPEKHGTSQLSRIVQWSLFLLPLLFLLALLGGYFFSGRILRPLRDMEEAAARISRGQDLTKRITLPPGTDELHRLADTFNAMFARLEKAFASERQFTSDVSHELRTPMAVITAQCEYMLEAPRTAEEYEAALHTILRQSSRMNTLIEDMLRLVRLEQKPGQFPMENLDLSALTTSVCEDMTLLQEQNITLTYHIEDAIHVTGSRPLLTRLLSNLIANAYRYGTANGWIHVTLASEGEDAALAVSDNGIGITPDEQEKIFHRFYRVNPARTGSGMGLGLSMVQEITRLHSGTLTVKSAPGRGSTFTLKLKKQPGPPSEKNTHPLPENQK
ncbi:MAG: HAMP domain-containing sensor histidine kinase [Eubacteriales bacterium]|nr:HAMP domain-containing sensor histidine kinase [Eubacteriales bacterium]